VAARHWPRPVQERPASAADRAGVAKRTVMYYIRQLPQYVRLLGETVDGSPCVDGRQAARVRGDRVYRDADRSHPGFHSVLRRGSTTYLFFVLALQRLISNAGRNVLLVHWTGDPGISRISNLRGALTGRRRSSCPRRIRRRLRSDRQKLRSGPGCAYPAAARTRVRDLNCAVASCGRPRRAQFDAWIDPERSISDQPPHERLQRSFLRRLVIVPV